MPDPVTSAIALAGKSAGEVVTPKLREALLGPLARAYGDHWGQEAAERLSKKREEKRSKNLFAHVRAVALLSPERPFDEVSNDPVFDEWLSSAAGVDAEVDPDLADFWRAALLSVANGETTRLRLLRTVKRLGPDDAAFLAAGKVLRNRFFPGEEFRGDYLYTQRAEQAGVFESPWQALRRRAYPLVLAITMPVVVYGVFAIWGYLPIENSAEPNALASLAIPAALLTLLLTTVLLGREFFGSVRRLTPDGCKLLALRDRLRCSAEEQLRREANAHRSAIDANENTDTEPPPSTDAP